LVFTEHGALQAANVLNSSQANKTSVFIVRTFVRLREMALTNEKLKRKFNQLEKRVSDHDEILIELVAEIRKRIDAPKPKGKTRSIGFIESDKMKKIVESGGRGFFSRNPYSTSQRLTDRSPLKYDLQFFEKKVATAKGICPETGPCM
jgi:hypothetical protein